MTETQYYMYGIITTKSWYDGWKLEIGRDVDTVINEGETTVDDISCVFYSRDGKFLIIGKIIETFDGDKPIEINELNDDEKHAIETSVLNNFNLKGEFHHYFVKSLK